MVSACPGPQDRTLSSLESETSLSFRGCAISHVLFIHPSLHPMHIYKVSTVCLALWFTDEKTTVQRGKEFCPKSPSFLEEGRRVWGINTQHKAL